MDKTICISVQAITKVEVCDATKA